MGGARLPVGTLEARMTEQIPDEPDQPDEFHRNRREHGGEIDRLDEDQLARLTEEERVEAGGDDYDPDEGPPATDAPPPPGVTQTQEEPEARGQIRRAVDERELGPASD